MRQNEVRQGEVINTAMQMVAIGRLVLAIPEEHIQAVLNQASHEQTLAPLLDPTYWIKHSDSFQDTERFSRAFVEFRHALEALRPERVAR